MSFRSFILWNHERGTLPYDVFCLLIVSFIFLTPKPWFEKQEKLATQTSMIIVKAQDFTTDNNVLTERVKEFTGNPNAKILNWSEKKHANGDIYYEIEIAP